MTMTQLRVLLRKAKSRSNQSRELSEEVGTVILRKGALAGYALAAEARRFWEAIASLEMICRSCDHTAPIGAARCPRCKIAMV